MSLARLLATNVKIGPLL